MQPAGGDRGFLAPRDEVVGAWAVRAGNAAALLSQGEWAGAREAADSVLAEFQPPEPFAPGAPPATWDPTRLPAEQAPAITETLLVGLRSAFLMNDLQAAMQFGSAALRTAAHFGLAGLEARAHNDLAGLYGRRDFQERAFHHLKAGVEVLERAGLPVLPQLLTNLGNVYNEGLRLDEALGCFRRGREGFEQAGEALGAAVARSNEGRLLVQTGKVKQGLVALEDALATFMLLENRAYVGVTLGKIGTAHAVAGDSYVAEQWFTRALAELGEEPLPFRGEVHEAYGAFLLERGRADEALTEYQRAEEYYQLAAADGPAIGMLRYQAQALDVLGRHREAYERLSRSIESTEQLDRLRGQALLDVMLLELESGLARDHELPALTSRVVSEANRSLRAQTQRLERISTTDELTGLYNRRYLNQRLRDELSRATRHTGDVSLILFDIDSFKAVNDRFSHMIGDEVLKRLAVVLKGSFRRSDVIARWGGEEFAVLLPETSKDAALSLAERAREAVLKTDWSVLASGMSVTVSAGLATAAEADGWSGGWSDPGTAPDCGAAPDGMNLLKLADGRLYAAKNSGRNRTASS